MWTKISKFSEVGAIAELSNAGHAEPMAWIASHLPDTSIRDRLLMYAALPAETNLAEAARRHGTSGFVIESVPFALFAAQQVARLGFASMLEHVVTAGGDTDTNASIAGQIAGTALGFTALPSGIVDQLPEKDFVLSTARTFAESVDRRR